MIKCLRKGIRHNIIIYIKCIGVYFTFSIFFKNANLCNSDYYVYCTLCRYLIILCEINARNEIIISNKKPNVLIVLIYATTDMVEWLNGTDLIPTNKYLSNILSR